MKFVILHDRFDFRPAVACNCLCVIQERVGKLVYAAKSKSDG